NTTNRQQVHGASRPPPAQWPYKPPVGNPAARPRPFDLRILHVALSRSEFGLVHWARNKRLYRPGDLNAFTRRALLESVGKLLAEIGARGGKIPPGVAKDYDTWKSKLNNEL